MKKSLLLIAIIILALLVVGGCVSADVPGDVDDPAQNGENNSPGSDDPEDPFLALPATMELTVIREGTEEIFVANKTIAASGLAYYLFPEFTLGQDEGFDILMPTTESGYLPVSLTISNNGSELSLEEALDKAKSYYPGIEFTTESELWNLCGNMEQSAVAYGMLDNDWVICGALAGANGSISFWGQGNMETAEGLRVLLLTQISAINN